MQDYRYVHRRRLWHMPIVLDGVISMAAALVAERLFPGVREYLLPPSGKGAGSGETGGCASTVPCDPCGNGSGRRNRSSHDVHTSRIWQ